MNSIEQTVAFPPSSRVILRSLFQLIRERGPITMRQAIPILEAIWQQCQDGRVSGPLYSWCTLDHICIDADGGVILNQAILSGGGLAPSLAAPEIGHTTVDAARAEVYFMAALLFWTLTGRQPDRRMIQQLEQERARQPHLEPSPELRQLDEIGAQARQLLADALHSDPARRPASPSVFWAALRQRKNFIGNYRLIERIGSGMTGTVYRAQRLADGNPVAIKILARDMCRDSRRLIRFYQEARLCMELDHPQIIRVLEVGADRGRHFLVMELISGVNLETFVKRRGRLDEKETLRIAADLTLAAEALHRQGVIHRDINPRNILIDDQGNVKLIDLGLAKTAELQLTMTGYGMGNPQYIAPEQFRGAKRVSETTDIYALGATMYWMVTGHQPFAGDDMLSQLLAKAKNNYITPTRWNATLTPLTLALIQSAMAANEVERPQTASQFHRRVRHCRENLQAAVAPSQTIVASFNDSRSNMPSLQPAFRWTWPQAIAEACHGAAQWLQRLYGTA